MKKALPFFTALMAFMVLGNTSAQAQTGNELCIGNTWVTTSNAKDILGDGHFKYDASTKTLTVTSATLTVTNGQGTGIQNRNLPGLIIKLVGTSTFNTYNAPISVSVNTKITGTGTLNGTSTNNHGLSISGDNTTLTIDGPKLNLTAGAYGVNDYNGAATLKVTGTTTSVNLTPGSLRETIHNLKTLSLGTGIYITSPAYATFSSSLKSITVDGKNPYKGTVTISTEPTFYGMYIGETRVTAANCSNILNDGTASFRFDPATKTLTVTDADFSNSGSLGGGIDNRDVDGLIVQFIGDNKFNTRNVRAPRTCYFCCPFIYVGKVGLCALKRGG